MAAKLSRWISFTILFSLIPLLVDFLFEYARTNGNVGIASFGRHGEMYLLASAICAVGLGEIVGTDQKYPVGKILVGGASVLIIAFATALYTISASDAAAALSAMSDVKPTISEQVAQPSVGENVSKSLLKYSFLMFIFACVVSTSCIVLSEKKTGSQ